MTQPRQPDADVLRRHFVAIATSTYDDERYAELPVKDAVRQLEDWLSDRERLSERSFDPAFPELAQDPDEDQIRAVFRKTARPWSRADAAVVFVTGHGEVADQSHWLVLRESEYSDLPGTGLRTADLISWLKGRHNVDHLLLIVDACFAGAIVSNTVDFDEHLPPSWLILPSAARDGQATAGALTTAIGNAVEKLRGGQGQKYGTNQRFFRVSDFIDTVREFLPGQDIDPLYRGNFNAEHVCLPNPHYAQPDTVATQPRRHDLALPQSDLDTHWAPRASGTTDGRWLFTGRADLMRELIAATHYTPQPNQPQVTLVAGRAGCGKSAVLARLVTLSDPTFVHTYAEQIADIPADLLPEVGAVDVAVLATGKYPHEVLGQISDAIGAQRPEGTRGDADLQLRIDACNTALDTRWDNGTPTTVVVDALDEAEDPLGIARMLTHLASSPGLHLIIGVRSPGSPDELSATTKPTEVTDLSGPLADQIERMFTARRLRVDDDHWWRQNDIRDYAASILRHTPGSPYQDTTHGDLALTLATVIADHVGRSFLVARLAATALTQTSTLVNSDDPDWRASLPDGVIGALRADLHRLHPTAERRLATVELLRAVAFAYGRGLPWGEIWPLVANAVADRYGKYGDRDIADLLASPFSAYLITDQEDDITVYRLFHDALRRTLRTRWRELLHNPNPQ
jgi:hypothetical protein